MPSLSGSGRLKATLPVYADAEARNAGEREGEVVVPAFQHALHAPPAQRVDLRNERLNVLGRHAPLAEAPNLVVCLDGKGQPRDQEYVGRALVRRMLEQFFYMVHAIATSMLFV